MIDKTGAKAMKQVYRLMRSGQKPLKILNKIVNNYSTERELDMSFVEKFTSLSDVNKNMTSTK